MVSRVTQRMDPFFTSKNSPEGGTNDNLGNLTICSLDCLTKSFIYCVLWVFIVQNTMARGGGKKMVLDWPGRALHGLPLTLANLLIFKLICEQGYRGIYCAKYYGQGGWEKMVLGKKMKNEAVRIKMKKKEKGERKRGRVIFC